MSAPLLPFQEFQYAFARHIRAPRRHSRPEGVPARRMQIYNELLYNNLTGFLDSCFPVSRQILGERRWGRLSRTFFAEWRSHTPYFREIPREFLRWLMEGAASVRLPVELPPFLIELAHYEWAELAVDVMDATAPSGVDAKGDLLNQRPVVNPALMNLAYQWPVHRIGPAYRPRKSQPVQLLVFRDEVEKVRFMEINPVSARLIALLQPSTITGREALLTIAQELVHPEPESVLASGMALLNKLRDESALLGVLP